MKFKLFSDNAKSFTFKHDFETMDHANVTSTAILGYMVGTYEQQPTEITIGGNEANNTFTMVVEYVEDEDLTKVFNRICESFESYSKGYAEEATAYELTTIANSVTDNPLPEHELARTFESIVKAEIRKRGVNGN